ncbi:Epoxide hydrolase 1 [Sarcoptes scabiei]|uniref:Epoxide hydrolase n=1 Tax=Sarcoptes scabiei TaxID=52283 RepID=A0A834RA69_SARSC|nr:Epoxide hydrolase 1 [Sarcoptes scabiei]
MFRSLKSSPSLDMIASKTNSGWFGRNESLDKNRLPPEDDQEIKKFKIEIPQERLDDLRKRLEMAKLFESIEETNFRYGFNSQTLAYIVDYWLNQYQWREWEEKLNEMPQYVTEIEGLRIHFVHMRPENPEGVVVPLLIIHGWPGSFFEYYKAIPMLLDSTNQGLSFDLIIPSIPGYGFSEEPHQEGFNVVSTARIFCKLMDRLGFNKFFVHGGDWGAIISKTIALMYPERVRGIHTTLYSSSHPKGFDRWKFALAKLLPNLMIRKPSQRKMFNDLLHYRSKWYLESGYLHEQSTKPDTVGAALTDSPIGLAAYILEKFSTWTDPTNIHKPDGGLMEKFRLDELLTNVMIYWFSDNVTSSMRYYKENVCPVIGAFRRYKIGTNKLSRTIPAGYAAFPNEIVRAPKFVIKMTFPNLVHYSEPRDGGHFAAFEEPRILTDDIKKFVFVVVTKL